MSTLQIQDGFIPTPGGKLYARRWTPDLAGSLSRVPVVLLHDSLGCVDLWRDFPAKLSLATGREVVAYDRLGFGRSDAHPGLLQAPQFIADETQEGFRSLCEALALEQFMLFGHSVGAGMAIACAAALPSACQGLITESAQVFVEDHTLQGIRVARETFAQPDAMQRLARYHGAKATWVRDAWIDSWLSPAFAGWHLDDALRQVRCPILALHGGNDEYGSTRHPRRIAALAADQTTLCILEGCGHVPHREQQDAVLTALRAWAPLAPGADA